MSQYRIVPLPTPICLEPDVRYSIDVYFSQPLEGELQAHSHILVDSVSITEPVGSSFATELHYDSTSRIWLWNVSWEIEMYLVHYNDHLFSVKVTDNSYKSPRTVCAHHSFVLFCCEENEASLFSYKWDNRSLYLLSQCPNWSDLSFRFLTFLMVLLVLILLHWDF